MLRRQLQALTTSPQQKLELLTKHAKFLEQSLDWQAAASSWMDAGDCEKAVEVLVGNKQTNTLLRLVRILPPINQQKKKDFGDDDFDYEVHSSNEIQQDNVIKAFRMVLRYFENQGDFDSALFVAQRLGDQLALLRLFVAQGMWDQVEDLGKVYPEMMPAIHEARAAAYLREGDFMKALERLRLAGNNEKEVAMIRALTEAATSECKFDMARSLLCQLQIQLNQQERQPTSDDQLISYWQCLKALRAKVLVMSGYLLLVRYVQIKYSCPDVGNIALMDLNVAQESDEEMVSVCSFLANYSQLPLEISRSDEDFLQQFEKMDADTQIDSQQSQVQQNQFVNSYTKPQLGALSQLDLGGSSRSLPQGVPEAVVWLVLQQVARQSQKIQFSAARRLLSMRLPQKVQMLARKRFMQVKPASLQNKPDEVCDRCPRCGAQLELLQQQVLTQRDLDVQAGLPMCCPALSDVCKNCGSPLVRSAVTLRVLPLVLVEPSDDSSTMELIEKLSGVKIANTSGAQVIKAQDDGLTDADLVTLLKNETVSEDGRGVVLPRDCYEKVGVQRCFVVDDYSTDPNRFKELAVQGVVKRVFLNVRSDCEIQFCQRCQFFFDAAEYEEAFVMGGHCPICQNEEMRM